jgi:glycosyltransferase involved in cell wall biosynthesis
MSRPDPAGTVLAFGEAPWTDYWQTRQQLLTRLPAHGWRVCFTAGLLSRWDGRGTPHWQAAGWRARLRHDHGVAILEPSRLNPLMHVAGIDRHLIGRFARDFLACVGETTGSAPIAYLFSPRFLPYVESLDGTRLVYHADDNFAAMRGWTDEQARMQEAVIARAELVVATTPNVAAWLGPAAAPKVMLLPNGADADAFEAGARAPCPGDLAAVPRPRISYVGSLNEKVDFPLLDALAAARPDWHWALIGKTWPVRRFEGAMRAAVERCRTRANVHFLDEKPYWELPSYVAHCDVNTMIYRTDGEGWWRDIYPLKLHEYLATGLPVVSADVAAVRDFAEVVAICEGRESWLAALGEALAGGRGTPALRIAVARANSWDDRASLLDAALRGIVASPGDRFARDALSTRAVPSAPSKRETVGFAAAASCFQVGGPPR